MSRYEILEGDNIEFLATSIGDYTIYFGINNDDTATSKYADNPRTATKFEIRMDKNGSLVGENNITFTNPSTILANTSHTETRATPTISYIKIRTGSTNTQIKVRWF